VLPAVRARRIKTIEADKRKQERAKADEEKWLKLWGKEGLSLEQARTLANYCHLYVCRGPEGQHWSAWDVLRPEEERYNGCPGWTVEQVQAAAREAYPRTIERCDRWIEHYENRLAYERAMLAEAGGIASDRTRPEVGGAARCWASPGYSGKGWSYIRKVNKVSVTVEDNWGNGGRNFTRTIPFDKLKAVMTRAEVEEKRAAGLLAEVDSGIGFYLRDEPAPAPREKPAEDPAAAEFRAMAASLRAGVQVVSAPNLFPTPPEVARHVVELAEIKPGRHRVLEPSAGTGAIVRALFDLPFGTAFNDGTSLAAVELNSSLADALRRSFPSTNSRR
jgi:hypothetical protein